MKVTGNAKLNNIFRVNYYAAASVINAPRIIIICLYVYVM